MCEGCMSKPEVRKAWLGNAAVVKVGHFHLEMVSKVRDEEMAHEPSAMVSAAMVWEEG